MLLLFADTCYVLSFAIIMLNTSLHNPNVRDKPGVDRFISMNRGINEGGDLPEELLRVRPTPVCYCRCRNSCQVYFSSLFLSESLRKHQKWALQNPWRWRKRLDTHLLQPWPRGLASQAWWDDSSEAFLFALHGSFNTDLYNLLLTNSVCESEVYTKKRFVLCVIALCSLLRLCAMTNLSSCLWGVLPLCFNWNDQLTVLWHLNVAIAWYWTRGPFWCNGSLKTGLFSVAWRGLWSVCY